MKKYFVLIILFILIISYGWESEQTKTRKTYQEWVSYSSDTMKLVNDDTFELIDVINTHLLQISVKS